MRAPSSSPYMEVQVFLMCFMLISKIYWLALSSFGKQVSKNCYVFQTPYMLYSLVIIGTNQISSVCQHFGGYSGPFDKRLECYLTQYSLSEKPMCGYSSKTRRKWCGTVGRCLSTPLLFFLCYILANSLGTSILKELVLFSVFLLFFFLSCNKK